MYVELDAVAVTEGRAKRELLTHDQPSDTRMQLVQPTVELRCDPVHVPPASQEREIQHKRRYGRQ